MKRRRLLITGVLLLLLGGGGAIVNVAVAWGCVMFPNWGFGLSERLKDDDGYTYLAACEAGWPLRALFCGRHEDGLHLGPELSYWLGIKENDTVPIRPLLPGFAINTIFYAAMLWVVFFVPGMVRRRIRRRRGRCPACAYPIGTSDVCTECGELLHTLMQRT